MNCDQATRRVLQSGRITVGADTVVRLPDIAVTKAPSAVRLVAATAMDFGDAPATMNSQPGNYPVTLAQDGARHASDGIVMLGTARNVESNGTPHAAALSPAEDDDGVSAPAQWQQGRVISLTVTASADCRLDAWVDWARNGQWSGALLDVQDQIAASLPLTAGANVLKIYVPDLAVPGATFARFRVSLGGCLQPSGPAPDGEVEDYPLLITTAETSPDPHALTVSTTGTWSGETWNTPPGQSDREVKFITLSSGGHQWPGGNDRVGWDGQRGVMDFFDAH